MNIIQGKTCCALVVRSWSGVHGGSVQVGIVHSGARWWWDRVCIGSALTGQGKSWQCGQVHSSALQNPMV